jgi:hypothetical protein
MGWSLLMESWCKIKVAWQFDKSCGEGSTGNPLAAQLGTVRRTHISKLPGKGECAYQATERF